MSVRLARFEMPNRLVKNEATATETYAQFIAEPFDKGYGHTIGNSLRRTLLSSIPGAAITAVRFDDALHEFDTIQGVSEDVTDVILNIKDIVLTSTADEDITLRLDVRGPAVITAGDIKCPSEIEILNRHRAGASLQELQRDYKMTRPGLQRLLKRARTRAPDLDQGKLFGS